MLSVKLVVVVCYVCKGGVRSGSRSSTHKRLRAGPSPPRLCCPTARVSASPEPTHPPPPTAATDWLLQRWCCPRRGSTNDRVAILTWSVPRPLNNGLSLGGGSSSSEDGLPHSMSGAAIVQRMTSMRGCPVMAGRRVTFSLDPTMPSQETREGGRLRPPTPRLDAPGGDDDENPGLSQLDMPTDGSSAQMRQRKAKWSDSGMGSGFGGAGGESGVRGTVSDALEDDFPEADIFVRRQGMSRGSSRVLPENGDDDKRTAR